MLENSLLGTFCIFLPALSFDKSFACILINSYLHTVSISELWIVWYWFSIMWEGVFPDAFWLIDKEVLLLLDFKDGDFLETEGS